MNTSKDVAAYLAAQSSEHRAVLKKLRATIRAAMPEEAEEVISYGMPAYRYGRGRPVVYFAGFKKHMSLFPGSVSVVKQFAKELKGFETTKGTIHFTVDNQLPVTLVRKIIKARLIEKAK